jgi:hypothetical protein
MKDDLALWKLGQGLTRKSSAAAAAAASANEMGVGGKVTVHSANRCLNVTNVLCMI